MSAEVYMVSTPALIRATRVRVPVAELNATVCPEPWRGVSLSRTRKSFSFPKLAHMSSTTPPGLYIRPQADSRYHPAKIRAGRGVPLCLSLCGVFVLRIASMTRSRRGRERNSNILPFYELVDGDALRDCARPGASLRPAACETDFKTDTPLELAA